MYNYLQISREEAINELLSQAYHSGNKSMVLPENQNRQGPELTSVVDSCDVQSIFTEQIHHCRDDYNWIEDDTKHYLPGWVVPPANHSEDLKKKESPWVYKNSLKLKSAPYPGTVQVYKGGGYVFRLVVGVVRYSNFIYCKFNTCCSRSVPYQGSKMYLALV